MKISGSKKNFFGAVEAGGTKFVLAAGAGYGEIAAKKTIPTTAPAETLSRAADFFRRAAGGRTLDAIGIACFGPLDIGRGVITTTPKPGWAGTDIAGFFEREFGAAIAIDTDVNGAALGETLYGAGKGLSDILYITVGTGIGGGAIVNSAPLRGLMHPEMGHIIVPRSPMEPNSGFNGVCPYHECCLEGMASGPAIEARWGKKAEDIDQGHDAWKVEAHYLGHAIAGYILTLSPKVVVLGGGVMKTPGLIELVRRETARVLNGYLKIPAVTENIDGLIVPPGLGDDSGIAGAFALAAGEFR